MVIFPYYSHIFRDSYGSGMGIVWEAYHKEVPLLGVPENPIESNTPCCLTSRGLMQALKFSLAAIGITSDQISSRPHTTDFPP